MNEKFLNMTGMAKRAGKVITGESLCKEAVRKGKSKLIITALDASENTKKSMKNSCDFYGVAYVEAETMADLGKYTGASARAVVSVNDSNFAKAILNKLD